MATAAAKKSVADINDSKKRVEDSVKREKALSRDVLKDFTWSLRNIDRVVVEAIGIRREKILENKELRSLVHDYFEASRQTLEFLNELENCLRVLEKGHFYLLIAIQKYEHGKIAECRERLEKFSAIGDPFQEKFFPMHDKLLQKHEAVLKKAEKMQDEVVEEKKNTSWWTDVFTIVNSSATAVAGICLAVAAVCPPAALLAGAAVVVGVGVYIWGAVRRVKADDLETKEKIIKTICARTKCVMVELDTIKIFVENLKNHIKLLSEHADEASKDEDSVTFVMSDVKKWAELFRQDINDLTVHTRKCKQDVFSGRDKVLGFIRQIDN